MKRKLKKIVTYIIMTAVLSLSNSFMVHAEDITDTEAGSEMEASTDAVLENDTEAADDAEALSVTEAVDEYMPVGGWEPAEIHIVEETGDEQEENNGVMFFGNSINSASETSSLDSVFTAGAGYVGYASLSTDAQREFYDRIDAAATEFMLSGEDIDAVIKTSDSVNYNVYVIDTIKYTSFTKETYDSVQNELLQVFLAYDYDHPAYYWINNSVWLESDHNSNLYLDLVTYEEYAEASARKTINDEIIAGVNEYAKLADKVDDNLDKIAVIHDLIIRDVDYAYDSENNPIEEKWAHSVQGVFDVHNKVVCEGYADTFSLMMNYLDIPNYYIVGTAGSGGAGGGGGHAWNLVSDDDGETYMYMDLTWDDQGEYGFYDKYFGMPQSDFDNTHLAYSSNNTGLYWLYALPNSISNSFEGTYYYKAGYYCDSSNLSEELSKSFMTKTHRFHDNLTFLADSSDNRYAIAQFLRAGMSTSSASYKGTTYYIGIINLDDNEDLTSAEISIPGLEYVYTRSSIEPEPTVTLNGVTLIKDLNYTVSYDNNSDVSTEDTKASVVVTGAGNFTGSTDKQFKIVASGLVDSMVSLSPPDFEYNGEVRIPDITVKSGETDLTKGTDYEVSISKDNPTEVGTYTITLNGLGGYPGTVSKTFTISEASISSYNVSLTEEEYTYDGVAKKPGVTLKNEDKVISDSNYTISYEDNIDAGTACVILMGKGNYKDSVIKYFTINKANPEITSKPVAKSGLTYTGRAQSLIKAPGTVKNGTMQYSLDGSSWFAKSENVTATDVGTYKVWYRVIGDENYNDIAADSITVTIEKVKEQEEDKKTEDDSSETTVQGDSSKEEITDGKESDSKEDTSSEKGTKSDGNTDTKADEKSDEQKSDDKTEAKTGDKTDDKTGTKSDDKTDDKAGEKSTEEKVEPVGEEFASYQGCDFYEDEDGDVRCYDDNGKPVINNFKCDGEYTYYFQLDGTAMKDRLTYHPDGEHVIYFDENGHEVFSDFAHVKKTIAGEDVDDYCFFNVFGYMYVDVLTYDKSGTVLYYANPYGVMEMGKWFQFSDTVVWADGTEAVGIAGGYGYANSDGTLLTNTPAFDWEGRPCYMQGNGVALY